MVDIEPDRAVKVAMNEINGQFFYKLISPVFMSVHEHVY
jgi:hypothetical protein